MGTIGLAVGAMVVFSLFVQMAEAEGREYEPLTQRGARVHAVRQAKAVFAEMRERLELARDAWAEAREEVHGHVSAGLAALRAVAGRQAKELDQDEIKTRLSRIAGRDLGADGTGHEAGADAIRDRLKQVLGRDKPDPRIEQQLAREAEHLADMAVAVHHRPVARQNHAHGSHIECESVVNVHSAII